MQHDAQTASVFTRRHLMMIVDCVVEEKRRCDAGGLEVGLHRRWRSAMAWPRMFREQAAAALEKVEAKSGVEVGGQQ